MRGVNIGTKLEVYDLIRIEADRGRTFLWYTTEMDELQHCDHVYVFRNGIIVADLARGDLTEERVIQSSFWRHPEVSVATTGYVQNGAPCGTSVRRTLRALLPAFSLALVVMAIAWLNPRAISYFGFTLMLNLAVADGAGHHRADVRHRRQRPRPFDRCHLWVLSAA